MWGPAWHTVFSAGAFLVSVPGTDQTTSTANGPQACKRTHAERTRARRGGLAWFASFNKKVECACPFSHHDYFTRLVPYTGGEKGCAQSLLLVRWFNHGNKRASACAMNSGRPRCVRLCSNETPAMLAYHSVRVCTGEEGLQRNVHLRCAGKVVQLHRQRLVKPRHKSRQRVGALACARTHRIPTTTWAGRERAVHFGRANRHSLTKRDRGDRLHPGVNHHRSSCRLGC